MGHLLTRGNFNPERTGFEQLVTYTVGTPSLDTLAPPDRLLQRLGSGFYDPDTRFAVRIVDYRPSRTARQGGDRSARCSKRANCWLRFTGGSLKGLTRAI